MALKVSREDTWVAGIEDRPGSLAGKLDALARAGAQLEFLIARRAPEKPGTGVVFLTPVGGAKQLEAAKKAGFRKSEHLHSVRIEGQDKPGLGAKLTRTLAAEGINLRGLSAAVIGKSFVAYLALDTAGDANKAAEILKRMR
jgi:predicted amino acid-binding ACT domain protein